VTLDRQAQCPSCGAPITFKLGAARAQVCGFCRFVVVRTDRGLMTQGRMADLLELPSPFAVGGGGFWGPKRFEVEGRAQYDRVGAASAPWQEFLLGFPEDGSTWWIASAQGRWYATREVAPPPLPPSDSLRPGALIDLGPHGHFVVQEVGQRRLLSAQGNLTGIPKPEVVTRYADLSGPRGAFGTIDYGDGREPPVLFVGEQFDPAGIRLDSGVPLEAPAASVRTVECPTCGGNLPLLSERSERMVCQYCGTPSDIRQGHLQALGRSPQFRFPPRIAIGAEGQLRGVNLVCCGSMVRSCFVDGERYHWTEYLLWGGATVGYWWLMEENGAWTLVTPLEVGDVSDSGTHLAYRGETYTLSQSVHARVEQVIGEFYWKVANGETVDAAEFAGSMGKVSREHGEGELTYSFCGPLNPGELEPFGITVGGGASGTSGPGGGPMQTVMTVLIVIALVVFVVMVDECDDGGSGGGFYGGGYYSK